MCTIISAEVGKSQYKPLSVPHIGTFLYTKEPNYYVVDPLS